MPGRDISSSTEASLMFNRPPRTNLANPGRAQHTTLSLRAMASSPRAMASSLASNLLAMASKLPVMASNLIAMASNGIQPSGDGLQPRSDGLPPCLPFFVFFFWFFPFCLLLCKNATLSAVGWSVMLVFHKQSIWGKNKQIPFNVTTRTKH